MAATVGTTVGTGTDFAALSRYVKAEGLLQRRKTYYAFRAAALASALGGVVAGVCLLGNSWYQLLLAGALGVVLTQIAFLGHDAGHQQICRTRRCNDLVGTVAGNLFVGLSYGWWVDEHTRHHLHPNHEDRDPDVAESVLAFTEGQVDARRGFARLVAKHEAALFFPLLTLEGLNLHVSAVGYLWNGKRVRWPRAEKSLLIAHLVALFGLPLLAMPLAHALVFVALSQAVFGVYMGCSFAPNHKGMPMVAAGDSMDFLRRQVVTSRNISGSRLVDTLLGGLNYQIEHHLFPSMPSPALRRLQPAVRRHCAQLGIQYTETKLFESYRIALRHMHQIGERARVTDKAVITVA